MLRRALLRVSRSQKIKNVVTTVPVTAGVVERFIAGETSGEVVAATRRLVGSGLLVSIDYLGEHTTDPSHADAVVVTPHLGASTVEAQDKAGTTVAEMVRLALEGQFVPYAVNVSAGAEVSEAELTAWVAERVAPYKKLRAVRFTDQVPRSPSGKLLRRVLVEAERAGPA